MADYTVARGFSKDAAVFRIKVADFEYQKGRVGGAEVAVEAFRATRQQPMLQKRTGIDVVFYEAVARLLKALKID